MKWSIRRQRAAAEIRSRNCEPAVARPVRLR
jgi:hypothetical protein